MSSKRIEGKNTTWIIEGEREAFEELSFDVNKEDDLILYGRGIRQQIQDSEITQYYTHSLTINVFNKWMENMTKNKIIVYDTVRDSSVYFNSYEDAAKHLDIKVDRIKKVADTDKMIFNQFMIRSLNNE